jgi:hypothetical protein
VGTCTITYSAKVLAKDTESLKKILEKLSIKLKPVMYKMDVRPLLKAVLDQFFGTSGGLIDMLVEHIPSPSEAASDKVGTLFMLLNQVNNELYRLNGLTAGLCHLTSPKVSRNAVLTVQCLSKSQSFITPPMLKVSGLSGE